MSVINSFSSALKEINLNGGVGIVMPNWGRTGFHYARASDAASPTLRRALYHDYQIWKGLVPDQEKPLVDQAIRNLTAIDEFGAKMGGREGAASFLEAVHTHNSGEFCIDADTHQKASQINSQNIKKLLIKKNPACQATLQANERLVLELRADPILAPYLPEGALLTNHNLNNYERLKDRIRTLDPSVAAQIAETTQVLDSLTLEDAETINAMNQTDYQQAGLSFHALKTNEPSKTYEAHKAKIASSLRPLLNELYEQGKIVAGKPFPIKLVLFGNNDIRNSMDMVVTTKVIRELLLELGPKVGADLSKVKIPLYFSSFGGHPTTAAFSAFVELMTPKEVHAKLKTMVGQYPADPIKKALFDSAHKLPQEQKEKALAILNSDAFLLDKKLDELFKQSPDIFKVSNIKSLTKLPLQIGPVKFFNGVGESVTHSSLVRELGELVDEQGEPYVTVLIEAHSTNTGDNVQNLVHYFPVVSPDDAPHMIIFDSFEMKRQLGTALTQFDTRSGGNLHWKSMRTQPNFMPSTYFQGAYTTDQLVIDAAARGAELNRSIAFPIQGYTAPLPSPAANYRLLADFYARESGKAPEQVMQMRLVDIKAGAPFSRLENQIVPGHDPNQHVQEFRRRFVQEQTARLLRTPDTPTTREYFKRKVELEKESPPPLKFKVSNMKPSLAR